MMHCIAGQQCSMSSHEHMLLQAEYSKKKEDLMITTAAM